MTLNLVFRDCLVCGRDLALACQEARLDEIDEEGNRSKCQGYFGRYALPPARFRQKIAPDLCDWCWMRFQDNACCSTYRRRGYFGPLPPFRSIYLWAWVADHLARTAKEMGKEERRLVPHLAAKADRAATGRVRRGPVRVDGPRAFKYIYR